METAPLCMLGMSFSTGVSPSKSQDVPVAVIREEMGHATERTTRIYLKSFDNTFVDSANQKVISVIA